MSEAKWYLRTQDETFGPETEAKLVEWAKLGRIQPGQEISDDNIEWRRVEDVPFLDMRFSIDIGDGNPRGPFNRAAAEALLASGRLPPTSTIVETRAPFPEETPPAPEPAEEPVAEEPVAEAPQPAVEEVRVEVPVEKVVEKIVEVPVEKIVEKIVEKRVEVPVEKIVEKIVVDETRVKELEGLLEEERRHTADLQARLDESSRAASDAAKAALEKENGLRAELSTAREQVGKYEESLKDAADRENKYEEQVKSLEDELRRLPQAASEVADIQAAVYSIITGEAEELAKVLDAEKREFEELKERHQKRADQLTERRRELLKRSGANIEDMTRKALVNRPEDPRAAQLRREYEDFRRAQERLVLDKDDTIRELTERLRQREAEGKRAEAGIKDLTQVRQEAEELRARLQDREKELMEERQINQELRQNQAAKQQALLARLASLESPCIGTSGSLSTNQSREAKQVKLAGWMSFRK